VGKSGVAALVTAWAGGFKHFGIRAAGIATGVIAADPL
tara:strand:- start:647 stop:760 length:114 start_codon:yes stop_codon:yes gene_type:complete